MKILFLLSSIFIFGISSASNPAEEATLNLKVNNIQHDKGSIYIAVFDNEDDFMKKRFSEAIVKVGASNSHTIQFKLPLGKYAMSIFHDVNDNEDLNTNWIGIPKEPYGFSNNPSTCFFLTVSPTSTYDG